MMAHDLRIAAFVDGELSPTERGRFEADMAADPALAQAVARQRALRARLAAAYDPVLAEPVPAGLELAAQAANDRPAGPRPAWRAAAAMAACLVIGVLAGRAMVPSSPVKLQDGVMVAGNGLAKALDGKLAGEAGPVKMGVSFRTNDGAYCRTFQSAPDRLAGLACRRHGRWIAQTLAAWRPEAGAGYRTAGAETPPEVLAAMDRMIAGDPLDATAERAARARGWR